VPADWYTSSTTIAPTWCAFSTIARASWRNDDLKITCDTGTSRVCSSMASSNRSSGMVKPSSDGTTSIRAPRSRRASYTYITVGKFRSV